jgi:hypothetical protein
MTKNNFPISFYFTCLLFFSCYHGQVMSQTLRGRVLENVSHVPLSFVTIGLFSDSLLIQTATSDLNGYFKMTSVPVGRYSVRANFVGYTPAFIPGVIVNSGKETILNIELEERVTSLKEVEVKGIRKDQTLNEMTLASTRMFSVDETNRYAGSRSDPGRMASNFAGVSGADDSRNDIVVRGNSPLGVLWRIEGIDVPNPNHFAVPGTTGGGVSVINSKVLDNSDFLSGAFPAEYGNSIAGVLDLKFRSGNNEKHEFTSQLGFLGTELTAEGPISKEKKSSYLFAYRYSTLKLFESFKIKIGTDAVPNYQDLSFKINFPSAKGGSFSIFGIGGTSKIDILVSTYTKPETEIYGEKDKDQYFGSSMGVLGIEKTSVINSSSYIKFTMSYQKAKTFDTDYKVFRNASYEVDSLVRWLGYTFLNGRLSGTVTWNKKINAALNLRTGLTADRLDYNLQDSIYNSSSYSFVNRLDYTGYTFLIQPFIQCKYKFSELFSVSGGLHAQFLTLNNSESIEPRLSARWELKENQSFSFGWGMHSQMQPYYIYFYHKKDLNGNFIRQNHDLSFTRSIHYVLGYDLSLKQNSRIKIETYYMHLYRVPVSITSSSYSVLNEGASFERFFPPALVNAGTGRNYGAEFTFEKFFSRTYFTMLTASLYDSKYVGSDGILRNTSFNGNYVVNLLAGKEFSVGKKHTNTISTGIKVTQAGGQRYTPVDITATKIAGEIVETDSLKNSKQFKDYFRLDLKIGLKINAKKITHEIAFDLVNVFNVKNILTLIYNYDPSHPSANPVQEEYQLGFLPLFYYKIDF